MTAIAKPATLISIDPPYLPTLTHLYRWTREEYRRLGQSGIMSRPERIELIDGLLVEKPVKGPKHETSVRKLNKVFSRVLPDDWFPSIGSPAGLDDSEPEPDVSIVRGDIGDYTDEHPGPDAVGIAIEVSDSTLKFDRSDKGFKYSGGGIPVYWIVNVNDRQVEVYTDPDAFASPARYATQAVYKPGDAVPIVLDGVTVGTVAVIDLLP